ncbi:MAG: type IX secretion system plug protein domain-containing protein [Bacteroidota bacterium]
MNLLNRFLLLCLISWATTLLLGCPLATQEASRATVESKIEKKLIYDDFIYETNIRTVQLYRGQLKETYPVIYMGVVEPLVLEFDELIPLEQRESDLFVDIINCNAAWEPSNVLPIEFYEGFVQDRVDIYQRSEFTKVPYVHYRYSFPQENESFKMSGNYLLKVYRGANPKDVVLTRRFVVADRQVKIDSKYLLNERVERLRLSEFAFDLYTPGGLNIINPAQDLMVVMLQNFRWDNGYIIPQPRFYADNRFEYYTDLTDIFDGGNEFRRHECFSTRLYSESIRHVEERENIYDIYLFADEPRNRNSFAGRRDRNGSYAIRVQEWKYPDIQADYVRNHFTLQSREQVDGEVYVFGRFSDWQTRPENRMTYNAVNKRYEGEIILKQGLYDYEYVIRREDQYLVDERTFEGKHLESENFYTILVYYRSPTDRTDRLIGFQPINYYE